MARKKTAKTNAMRMIEQAGIPYEVYTYRWKEDDLDARHAAADIGRNDDEVYKTILALGDKEGVLVAVIPSNRSIDMKKIARLSGNKRVELLPLKDLEKTSGYVRGGCSPIGMKRLYPTFIDEAVLALSQVIVSAGQRGLQVGLAPKDLLMMTEGRVGAITMAIAHSQ